MKEMRPRRDSNPHPSVTLIKAEVETLCATGAYMKKTVRLLTDRFHSLRVKDLNLRRKIMRLTS